MAKRHRCEADDCRKLNVGDSKFCADHKILEGDKSQPTDPLEITAITVDKSLAATWGRVDAEIRNAILGQRVHELEMKLEQVKFVELQKQFQKQQDHHIHMVQKLRSNVDQLRKQYEAITNKIAADHNLDPAKMEIDPESAEVKDLSFLD